jgi:hypothetical protein
MVAAGQEKVPRHMVLFLAELDRAVVCALVDDVDEDEWQVVLPSQFAGDLDRPDAARIFDSADDRSFHDRHLLGCFPVQRGPRRSQPPSVDGPISKECVR